MGDGWTLSDAWILAAIAVSASSRPAGGLTLSEVVANADAIDHAIPTADEFVQAIARLTAVGAIGVSKDGGRYWPTSAGVQLCRRWRHGLFSWGVILPDLQKLGAPPVTHWSLPEGAFARAVQEWRERAERILQRTTRSKHRPDSTSVTEQGAGDQDGSHDSDRPGAG